MHGEQVQIVFYKSPLWGISVYPPPLICCWGSLGNGGRKGKRRWIKEGDLREPGTGLVLLLDLLEVRRGGG